MSQRIFYEIDGRVQGPVNYLQLQLLASSGMLQPHHRVRKENDENWFPAKQVKGLFSPAETATAAGGARPVAVAPPHMAAPLAPQPASAEAASWGDVAPVAEGEDTEINPVFDFFSDSADQFAQETSPLQESRADTDGNIPVVSAAPDPLPAPASPAKPEPKTTVLKLNESHAEGKPEGAADAGLPECVGQAAELLENDAVRLLDGKILFRLTRGWIQSMSKYSDGTTRTIYLRLGSLDAAALELRPTARRARGGPYLILSFVAGNEKIAMSIQGNDKPHRTFLEKVLLAAVGKSPNPK